MLDRALQTRSQLGLEPAWQGILEGVGQFCRLCLAFFLVCASVQRRTPPPTVSVKMSEIDKSVLVQSGMHRTRHTNA